MNFFAKKSSGHTAGFLCGRKSRLKIWRSIIGAVLCLVLFCTSIGGDLIAAAAADSIPVIVESERNTKEETPALDKDTESKKQTEEEKKAVYTLHLTHYFRFTVDGKGRNVRTEEKIKLTEKDFKDGVCDLNDFAYDKKQLTVTEAKPLSIKTFDKNHEGGARIVYGVRSGWRIVPADSIKNKGTVLREVFNGELSDYTFVPANVIRINMEYKYSNTGGLAGIDAAKPDIVETLPKENADGKYELECSIPTVEGFRIVLNPDPLNQYLVKKPTGNETPEQLKEALERGDFNVDVDGNIIYYRQENPGQQMHPDYKNIYSTEYNQKWNEARRLTVDGDNGYTAMAICGEDHDEDKNHGANVLVNPKLKVILTKKQLANALENGLDLTVSYRRNATWYTVNHWVPKELSGLTEEQIKNENKQTKEEGGVIYVLLDTEELQGRVGSNTKASAKTEGVYALLTSKNFSQKLIQSKVSTAGDGSASAETTVDIYYAAASSYRVIFDTDYTYIKRQQCALGDSVDFKGMRTPERKGYTFAGWQYLKKNAKPNNNGEYDAEAYEKVETDSDGNYTLPITAELLSQKAKLKETGGVPALHLYPIWKPAKTQVTVVLWTEDLTGVDDVQATVSEEGNSTYYKKKYQEYGDAPQTHEPVAKSGNSNYSKAGKFTMKVDTDGSLVKADDHQVLQDEIQKKVKENFSFEARDEDAIDASQFYKQHSFEIMHETGNEMDYSTTTANGDGKTMIYVYFTRNIYTLKFHYYGKATVKGTESNYCVANGTNGFSFAASVDKIIKDGELQFYYTEPSPADITVSKSNSYMRPKDITGGKDMPVPETITIRAKYGADLREVWPAARSAEHIDSVETYNGTYSADMISWATTDGKYRDDAAKRNSSHYNEATVMGLYASMDAEIIADPSNPDKVHHLVAYWSERNVSYYRYNHCYEVPGLDITSTGVKTISLHEGSTELKNTLYLVPVDNEAFLKYGFTDLMKVSYDENTKTVKYDDTDGRYYAVRGYSSNGKTNYYAVARRLETISTNAINKQNPSARTHMTRANDNADHTSKYRDIDGTDYQDGNITCGTKDDPYDLYFYYNRDRYRITYIAPKTNASEQESEVELGHIDLPYGAYVTKENYAFDLGYKDTNQSRTDDGKPKYLWTYPEGQEAAAVCPDRSPDGTAVWKFKGWGLGPAGVNMQWEMKEEDPTAPQAQVEDNFYIGSSMFLYAIWETPMHTVTFHLNGGVVSDKESIKEQIPANTRFTSSGTIPRPVRDGYTLTGWYKSDENGTIADNAEEFDFDSVIIEDQHVAAKWEKISKEKYSYNIYYVTKEPNDSDKNNETVQIDAGNDKIVESGGESYYVLEKEEKKDQEYASNTTLNLTAKAQSGYIPQQTNKTLTLEGTGGKTYNVIFYYTPKKNGSHTVNFVEAGTETKVNPTIVKTIHVKADQTVVTPSAAAVKELSQNGYELVNRDTSGYTAVINYEDLTWIDEKGKPQNVSTLAGNKIPDTVTYLVQPVKYTITYQNADGSPKAAENGLSAVTAAENTPVGSTQGKNPTQYTAKDTFTLKNPARVYDNGKYYEFSHWSLGDGTTVKSKLRGGETYSTLTVDKGTVGKLTFIANWKEMDSGSLKVSKTVFGGDSNREFNFKVTLDDTTINDTLGDMTFQKGVAAFKLSHGESKTAQNIPAGIKYTVEETDCAKYTVASSGEKGTIEKEKEAVAAFTNTPQSAIFTPQVKKVVKGDVPDDKKKDFSFTLTQDAGNPEDGAQLTKTEAAINGAGAVDFGEIAFIKAGTYNFIIAEEKGSEKGCIYDENIWKLTIKVVDKDGQLEVNQDSVTYAQKDKDGKPIKNNGQAVTSSTEAVFTNIYNIESIDVKLKVEKTVKGDVPENGGQAFLFELAKADDSQGLTLPKDMTTQIKGEGTANFQAVKFTKAGSYHFTITERNTGIAGYDYDTSIWDVEVVVTDDGTGTLTQATTYTKRNADGVGASNTTAAVFVNTYTALKPLKPDEPDTTSTESTKPSKSGSSTGASPKTGDEINMTLWLGLLGFSGIGMISILTTYVQRRKEKNNE